MFLDWRLFILFYLSVAYSEATPVVIRKLNSGAAVDKKFRERHALLFPQPTEQ